jgi:hypothetical protein
MLPQNIIDELLSAACAPIRYRTHHEILGESIPPVEETLLQEQIRQDPAVIAVLHSQSPDGWIGRSFHGYDSHEAGLRLLIEKGVSVTNSCIRTALQALETQPERVANGLGHVGKVFDEGGYGGTDLIVACLFAQAGLEDKPVVQLQIHETLAVLKGILSFSSVDEIAETYRGKLVYKPGLRWPGIYHLRLLAYTQAWRDAPNMEIVSQAIQRLVSLSPIPYIIIRSGSQLIAPAAFAMLDFNPEMASLPPADWMIWFHRMELLARLGVVHRIAQLHRQVDTLQQMLSQDQGWFTKELKHDYFKHWGAYTGLMLEPDWKNPRRRMFDLTFRSLLILKHSQG